MVILTVCIIVLILLVLLIYKESTGFRVVRYSFNNDKLLVPNYRIVLISDMHDRDLGNNNEEVIKAIINENPDAIFFAGDMVTSSMEPSYHFDTALSFIKRLADKYPIYYGIGNHEEKFKRIPDRYPGVYEDYCKRLAESSVYIIENEKVSIEGTGIDVYGLDMEYKYYRKVKTRWIEDDYLEGIFGKPDNTKVSILLAHNPEQFDKYALWKPDYVFSGHVHGGIVSLPFIGGVISPQLKLFPKYDAGVFEKNGSTMVLSRGLGTHTIPVRVFNKAEVIVIDIKKG